MRTLFFLILLTALLLSMAPVALAQSIDESATEDEGGLGLALNAVFCDKYLWRGINYDDGLIFQPEAVLSYDDFYFSLWGNIDLLNNNNIESNEIDFTLGYAHDFNSFGVETYVSYFNYFYAPDENTGEITIAAYLPVSDFTFFVNSSFDFLACAGSVFSEIGVDYEKEISDQFSFYGTVNASLASSAYNDYYLELDKSALNFVGANAGISYSPMDGFSINADFTLNINLDKDVKKELGNTSNLIQLTLTKEF